MDLETLLKLYPDSKSTEKPCNLEFEGFCCSRKDGHPGFHVAYGNENNPFIAWHVNPDKKSLIIWEKK